MNNVVPVNSSADKIPVNPFVFGDSNFKSSTTRTSPAFKRSLKALRNASCFVLRVTFLPKSRGLGPNTTPPPRHNGDANEPARARPVPFCFHGFLFVPA